MERMESADVSRFKFEWLYGVELFIDSEEGKRLFASLESDVERKTFEALLKWAVPSIKKELDDKEIGEFVDAWKKENQALAWRTFMAGLFVTCAIWDQRAWEKRFRELMDLARSCRFGIERIIAEEKQRQIAQDREDRSTPVVPPDSTDMGNCRPTPITLVCDGDMEALERMREFLDKEASRASAVLQQISSKNPKMPMTIPPPPSVHPTDPCLKMVEVPKSPLPEIFKQPARRPDPEAPVIEISYDDED